MGLDPNPFTDHPDGPWEARNRAAVEAKVVDALKNLNTGIISRSVFRNDRDKRGAKRWLWGQHHPPNERWKLLGRPYWSRSAYESWKEVFYSTPIEERFDRRGIPHLRTFPKRSKFGDLGLMHEHVVPQKVLLDWLDAGEDAVATILDHNIGAVITVGEDRRLPTRSTHMNPRDPWLRYHGSGIAFIENARWTDIERAALRRHGLFEPNRGD